jgi:phosphoglycerate dehydrogenase-like enzyme
MSIPMIVRVTFRLAAIGLLLGATFTAGAKAHAQAPDERVQRLIIELGLQEAAEPVRSTPGWRRPTHVLVRFATPEQLAALQDVAPGVEFVSVGSGAEAREAAKTADAMLGFCDADVIEAGPNIRWVQSFSAGVENCLRSPVIRDRGILLTNMQRVLGPAMAEHVMAMTLGYARRLHVFRDQQRDATWRREPAGAHPAFVLEGKTMLVVGLGGIGTEVARRAHAFGMTVTAIRNSDRPGPPFVSRVGRSPALAEFLREADVVVNTLPLTDDTRAMFDAKAFGGMKRGAFFVNVGRGGTVVTDALVQALEAGQIGGAGLDVFDPEPLPPGHPLWTMSNVVITPHVAADSDVDADTRWTMVRENLRRYVAGERMLSVVDTARGY